MKAKAKRTIIKWRFANLEELIKHVAEEFDVEQEADTYIGGSSKGLRHLKDLSFQNERSKLFKNPILNLITSPHGEIQIGNQFYTMTGKRISLIQNSSFHQHIFNQGIVAANADNCYTDQNGLEVCESENGKTIIYSDENQSLMFRSYKKSEWLGAYKEIGTEIKTGGGVFDAAIINSRYFGEAYGQTCTIYKYDNDSAQNDNDLDEYEWGIGSYPASRVASLCRVQWNGVRLSGIVSAGKECFVVGGVDPWPTGTWPEDWPPLNPDPVESLEISPGALSFLATQNTPSQTKKITLKSTFANPLQVTVTPVNTVVPEPEESPILNVPAFMPPKGSFSNVSGQITIPANGTATLDVSFTGESGLGFISSDFRIQWNSRSVRMNLQGKVDFLPKIVAT